MLTKNQIETLNLFKQNIFLKCSILQLSKKLHKKSYQRIYEAVKNLENMNILDLKKIGNANQISLKLTNQSISQLAFLDEQEAMKKHIPNYDKIMSFKELSNYLLIVTGSYAKGTAKKGSDLDLVILIPNGQNAMDIQKLAENLMLLFHPPVHLYVFNNKDFAEMLLDKKENYGKEIFRNHVIIKNAYIYYELLKETLEHGFEG